jgi:hypothetical protein
MPVGMFSPDANTDTVNPLGTTMFWAWSGAKSAVSAGQSGFLTTGGAASETAGGPSSSADAHTADQATENLSFMAHPPLTEIPDTDHGHFRFTPLFEPRGASRRQPRTAGTARRTILASQPC